jgi:hypothetical protein
MAVIAMWSTHGIFSSHEPGLVSADDAPPKETAISQEHGRCNPIVVEHF